MLVFHLRDDGLDIFGTMISVNVAKCDLHSWEIQFETKHIIDLM